MSKRAWRSVEWRLARVMGSLAGASFLRVDWPMIWPRARPPPEKASVQRFGIVVAAAVGVDRRRAAEIAGDDEQHFVEQAAAGEVVEERADGLVERRAEHVHAGADAGVVAVGVHVPAGVLHGDEAAAGLDEPAGHEHLLAERGGLKELLADAKAGWCRSARRVRRSSLVMSNASPAPRTIMSRAWPFEAVEAAMLPLASIERLTVSSLPSSDLRSSSRSGATARFRLFRSWPPPVGSNGA